MMFSECGTRDGKRPHSWLTGSQSRSAFFHAPRLGMTLSIARSVAVVEVALQYVYVAAMYVCMSNCTAKHGATCIGDQPSCSATLHEGVAKSYPKRPDFVKIAHSSHKTLPGFRVYPKLA